MHAPDRSSKIGYSSPTRRANLQTRLQFPLVYYRVSPLAIPQFPPRLSSIHLLSLANQNLPLTPYPAGGERATVLAFPSARHRLSMCGLLSSSVFPNFASRARSLLLSCRQKRAGGDQPTFS